MQCWCPPATILSISLLTLLQFVEYDQRAHRLVTLATFSFYVASKCRQTCPLPQDRADRRQMCRRTKASQTLRLLHS